jgi:hypothetical protein
MYTDHVRQEPHSTVASELIPMSSADILPILGTYQYDGIKHKQVHIQVPGVLFEASNLERSVP